MPMYLCSILLGSMLSNAYFVSLSFFGTSSEKSIKGCEGSKRLSCLSLVGQTHIRLRARALRAERVSKISACKKILNDATSIPRFGKVVQRRASANKDNSTARPLALAWWMNRLSTITSSPRRDAADPPPTAGQRHSHFVNCHSSGPRRIEQTCAPQRSRRSRTHGRSRDEISFDLHSRTVLSRDAAPTRTACVGLAAESRVPTGGTRPPHARPTYPPKRDSSLQDSASHP